MGRLRARLSKSPEDRRIQTHVAEAQRHLHLAMKVCVALRKQRGLRSRRASAVLAALDKATRVLAKVGRTTPLYDLNDIDLLPTQPSSDGDKK